MTNSANTVPPPARRQSLLWILPLAPPPNGATLRYLNFSKCLREAGFSVHFAITGRHDEHPEKLVDDNWIDGFIQLSPYRVAGLRNMLSRLLVLPSLRNWFMASSQANVKEELAAVIRRHHIDVCIVSTRDYLVCVPALTPLTRVVIDWGDSAALHFWRSLRRATRSGRWHKLPGTAYRLLTSVLQEGYYPKLAHANLAVSPADHRVLQRLCPGARNLRVVFNGSEEIDPAVQARIPNRVTDRLILSGRMDYPPNYEGAIWFIDRVLPLVRQRRPEAHLVIAGANPVPALKARESEFVRVIGRVPDMMEELARASLSVAPLFSGGGFRNKVLEAIAAGTGVVGTALASEFLPAELKRAVVVAHTPASFADAVIRCLESPETLVPEIEKARQFLRLHCTWQARTTDLISLFGGPDSYQ